MKFDIVISNPPYQEETGAGTVTTGKKPIYQNFIMLSLRNSSRFVCSIIPSRWTMRGVGLEQLYDTFEVFKRQFRNITDYNDWDNEVFGNQVKIAGGIMYFLIDKEHNEKCLYKNISKTEKYKVKRELIFHPTFIRDSRLKSIIDKVTKLKEDTLNNYCTTHTFGLESFQRGTENGDLELLTSSGWFNIHRQNIRLGTDLINRYKLAISGTAPGGAKASQNGDYKVLCNLTELKPNQVCTDTYIIMCIPNVNNIDNLKCYLQTKFVRSLIQATISSMHIIPYSFTYVPLQDFGIKWTDKQLYEKYGLDNYEIAYIERIIKQWEKD